MATGIKVIPWELSENPCILPGMLRRLAPHFPRARLAALPGTAGSFFPALPAGLQKRLLPGRPFYFLPNPSRLFPGPFPEQINENKLLGRGR